LSPLFGSCGLHVIWPFFGLPFCLLCDASNHRVFYWIFLPSFIDRQFFSIFEIGVGGNHPKVDLMFIDDKIFKKIQSFFQTIIK